MMPYTIKCKLQKYADFHSNGFINIMPKYQIVKNLPSTAQGKLNAVITPTVPRGFHIC
jgi:hypothetical protein